MVLGLGVVAAFYMYRFTVWAADAGGYWNLVTGARPNRAMEQAESAMEKAAEVAGQAAQSGKGAVKGAAGKVSHACHSLSQHHPRLRVSE